MISLNRLSKILGYFLLTLIIVGMITNLGDVYGVVALFSAFAFWGYIIYTKYKKMEQITLMKTFVSHQQTLSNFEDPSIQTVSQEMLNGQTLDHLSNQESQKQSGWVMFIGILNILLLYFMLTYVSLGMIIMPLILGIVSNSFAPFIFLAISSVLFLVYIVTTIIVIYRLFSKKARINSIKESHYLIFWPLILAIMIGIVIFAMFFFEFTK